MVEINEKSIVFVNNTIIGYRCYRCDQITTKPLRDLINNWYLDSNGDLSCLKCKKRK